MHGGLLSAAPRTGRWRRGTALTATMGIVASILVTHAPSAAASTTTADIVVHAGGIRTATSTVGGLAGAAFQAVPVGGGTTYTCTTGPAGTCTITVQTDPNTQQRKAYSVSETAAPGGSYLDPNLDYGGSSSGTAS